MKKVLLTLSVLMILSGCSSKTEPTALVEKEKIILTATVSPTPSTLPSFSPSATTEVGVTTTPEVQNTFEYQQETIRYEEPSYQEPVYEVPTYQEPTYDEPVYQEPVQQVACPGGIDPNQPCDVMIDRAGNAQASNGYWQGSADACIAAGKYLGGVVGHIDYTYNFLKIDWFALEKESRGKGAGTKLLKEIENIAIKEGCSTGFVETVSFSAPEFYKKQGYSILGQLDDFPMKGITNYWFYKRFSEL